MTGSSGQNQPGLRFVAVAQDLQQRISSGAIRDGEQLPSQQQMARTYRVSLTTIRAALALLEERGYVHSRHGVGTFASIPETRSRALVVDDDPAAIELLRIILEGEGIEVVGASSGVDAVQQVRGQDFDVIFLDLVMPGGSGITALASFRRMRIASPVVIVTGATDAAIIDRAMQLGPLTLIRKPVVIRQVRRVLERLGLRTPRH